MAESGTGPGPFAPPVQIGGPNARSVDIDLGVNGAAYAVWEQAGDVRAARLQDTTWSGVVQPLDVDPALARRHRPRCGRGSPCRPRATPW